MTLPARFSLTTARRSELDRCLRKRNLPASVALRMRIVLMLDEGASYHDIQEKLDTTAPTMTEPCAQTAYGRRPTRPRSHERTALLPPANSRELKLAHDAKLSPLLRGATLKPFESRAFGSCASAFGTSGPASTYKCLIHSVGEMYQRII
jgi:hypothetical protein